MTTPSGHDWITTYRASHDRLAALVEGLGSADIESQSYDTDWTVGQVLSHLGSGADIFGLMFEAGLAGTEVPGIEVFQPIWDVWNAREPLSVRDECLSSDAALVSRFESLGAVTVASFGMSMFGVDVDLGAFVRMRLSEHALHSWDIAVTFDPDATVGSDALALLLDGLDSMAARSGKGALTPFRVRVGTSEPTRDLVVSVGEAVSIHPAEADDSYDGSVDLSAEAFLRLVSGRLDPDHTPSHSESGTRGLADLRAAFPGF